MPLQVSRPECEAANEAANEGTRHACAELWRWLVTAK